ncbi:MAG: DUF494 family protein [Firmicutes bacterium]|nr:DUF494 family protein [Bacillota bacterium]
MNERVMEIVNLLIKLILQGGKLPESGATLVNDLLARGYNAAEIDAAFNLVFSLPEDTNMHDGQDSLPVRRVLDPQEKMRLTLEAQGQLETLSRLGLITPSEIDELLFYLSQMDAIGLDVSDISWLFDRIIKDQDRLVMLLGFDWSNRKKRPRRNVH